MNGIDFYKMTMYMAAIKATKVYAAVKKAVQEVQAL